jgi:hypothetical protein
MSMLKKLPLLVVVMLFCIVQNGCIPLGSRDSDVTPVDKGFGVWALSVNSNPQGAKLLIFDDNQQLREVGHAPASIIWAPRSPADAIVIDYQGQRKAVIPELNKSVFIDFTTPTPTVEGGKVREIQVEIKK